ncbi:hypothetical protein CCR85_06345 [Rhodothalassium salexigens]|uniref:hydrogenase maturation nickel metallochaperone HypA/HybF n=1 Tax=Rhodothalassium salexigens TaxID=1086 RepID=UPI00191174D6|nr:hydrogenase maturation nickel metallochaperone HypA [Rhodothalassium salexigens]MBK5911110.1 hypothetical protein [Rhodothalassium salexigens]MBK5919472.1 hypothetical protein [Rhodothalassium salexigens]
MHELTLCRHLLARVTRLAREREARAVTHVTVEVGPLSGVVPELLAQAFHVAKRGGAADTATLAIETPPPTVRCPQCGAENVVSPTRLTCPACGACRVDLLRGDGLILKSVDLSLDARPPS